MSLKVTKDNIFFILPESRYAVSRRIDKDMDEDFTLHVTAKIFKESLDINESFLIARNGMHSGISAYKDDWGNYSAIFVYWFKDNNGNYKVKQIFKPLTVEEIDSFNEYTMICDHYEERQIKCYFNDECVGIINYDNDEKISYEHSFYWFGCGSMIGPEEHRSIGEFEYKLCFLLNKKITMPEVYHIIDYQSDKLSHIVFNDLRKLNYDCEYRNNFAFLCDFKHYNRYKVWDISFSGNYPQFYIERNIYF